MTAGATPTTAAAPGHDDVAGHRPSQLGPMLFWTGAIIVANLLIWWGTLRTPFILDDYDSIVDNPEIETLWPLSEAFKAPPLSSVTGRPVVALTLAINYAIGERDPFGYHVFNLAVHTLNALLVMWLIVFSIHQIALRGTATGLESARTWQPRAPAIAGLTAMLFSVHPLQSEAATWTIQRTELLAAFFILATLATSALSATTKTTVARRVLVIVSILLAAVGMATKEMVAVLPLLVMLYDRTFLFSSWSETFRKRWPLYLGLALTWAITIAIMLTSPRGATVGFGHGVSALDYLMTQAGVIVHYLRLCFWPWPLAIAYDWPIVTGIGEAAIPGLIILILLGLTILGVFRNSLVGFLGAWFFILLAPTSSFVPIVTEVAAERRMYLPLLAVMLVVFLAVDWLLNRVAGLGMRRFLFERIAMVALLVAAASLSMWRVSHYETEVRIWQANHDVFPERYHSNAGLGFALLNQNQFQDSIPFLKKAIERTPEDYFSKKNLALALARAGHVSEATAAYSELLRIAPNDASVRQNLGTLYHQAGRVSDGIEQFEAALRLNPDAPVTLISIASTILDLPAPTRDDLARAVATAQQANALSGGNDVAMLEVFARTALAVNDRAAAVQILRHAAEVCAHAGDSSRAASLRAAADEIESQDRP
ncbi:MAG: tetratricopeptide repeat protein [Phycisphaerales bacterium]